MPRNASASLTPGQEMALIHRLFRRESQNFRAFVEQTGDADVARARQLGAAIQEYILGLHHHHQAEDELIWPKLHARAQIHDDLVTRMETQHHALDETIEAIQESVRVWVEAPDPDRRARVVAALTGHRTVLVEHLDDEEALVMPLVEEHLSPDEWEAVGQKGTEGLPPAKLLVALGAILEDATAEERAAFLGKVPLAGRVLWRAIGQRQYRRQMAELRQTA
jgi:iron-sulfur cluster repair protein YtfE (RIC family)